MTIAGRTVMVPVHTETAFDSPFLVRRPDADGVSVIEHDGVVIGRATFPGKPRFYALSTFDGVPYSKIAVLHGRDVLATTVLQTCIRYASRTKTCQFCSIGQSLAAGRTVARKTPEQLAEVARAAVLLDGVKHMVMTTGTPNATDRGAAILCESAFAVKAAVDLPIQAQCEPPDDDRWFERMKASGIDALGMHLEAVTPEVRDRIMPGKASVPLERYYAAFEAAVPVFGRGQVSTYILAGLGDAPEAILAMAERLIGMGVYPFVVPFVPISGTPLESHPAPGARLHARASCSRSPTCWPARTCARPTSRPAAAAAAPARRSPPTSARGRRHDPRTRAAVPAEPLPREVRHEPWERRACAALRRQVFCDEQGIFADDDRDAVDAHAIPICALSTLGGDADAVVGTVRIHEVPERPGEWWGSRLAVARAFRGTAALGRRADPGRGLLGPCAGLHPLPRPCAGAGTSPCSRPCTGTSLDAVDLHGRPHHLMQADLAAYPPMHDPEHGLVTFRRAA